MMAIQAHIGVIARSFGMDIITRDMREHWLDDQNKEKPVVNNGGNDGGNDGGNGRHRLVNKTQGEKLES